MAGGSPDFSYTVGMRADGSKLATDLRQSIAVITNQLTTTPINLAVAMPGLDTGVAQAALDKIQAQSQGITGLMVKTRAYTDENGRLQESISALTGYYQNADGKLVKFNKTIDNSIAGIDKNIASFNKMNKSVNDWITRSAKMGDKERESILSSGTALKDKIKLYDDLVKAGDHVRAKSLVPEINKLNDAFKKSVSETKRGANAIRSWGDSITNAFKQTISYSLSLGLVRKAQQQLQEALRYTIELNTEMTKIQILQTEGAQTPEEITELANSYNKLAQELGATTLEIAKGSVEWMRQGKTIEETRELLKASTMMSKLGNLEAAQSTEYLTSVLNGYQMQASEATDIVSKLVAVDNVAATSTNELATALRYSSAVAAEAGVSFEQLVSYIAVISQTTRQNAEMIGQAMKTIFTRMQDVMQGGLDEDGLGINNVERALQRVGMTIMENETEFRDLGGVLEELSTKWNTLNEVEQSNIAKAVAGTRQRNMFLILMQEMGTALELQEVQFNSAGLAVDRYGIYLESIEAKQAQLKNAMQALYMEEGFQDLIKDVIDLGTQILVFIKNIGGLKSVLMLVTTAFLAYKLSLIKTTVAQIALNASVGLGNFIRLAKHVGVLQAALVVLRSSAIKAGIALKTMTAGTILGVLVLIAGIITTIAMNAKNTAEKIEEMTEALEESNSKLKSLRDTKGEIADLALKYNSLKKEASDSAEAQEELIETSNRLKELIPTLTGYYDSYGNFIITATSNMQDLTKATNDEIDAELKLRSIQAEEDFNKTINALRKAQNKVNQEKRNLDYAKSTEDPLLISQAENSFEVASLELKNLVDVSKSYFEVMGDDFKTVFISRLTGNLEELVPVFVSTWSDLRNSANQAAMDVDAFDAAILGEAFKKGGFSGMEDVTSSIDDVISKTQTLAEISGKLSSEGYYKGIDDDLKKVGLSVEDLAYDTANGWKIIDEALYSSEESVIGVKDEIENTIGKIREFDSSLADWLTKQLEIVEATERTKNSVNNQADSIENLSGKIQTITSAMEEQNDKGYISNETAIKLAQSSSYLSQELEKTEQGWRLNAAAIQQAIAMEIADAQLKMTTAAGAQVLQQALVAAAQGNYAWSISAVQAANMTAQEISAIYGLLGALSAFSMASMPSFSGGGGGGGGGKSEKEKEIDAQVAALDREKEAIQENKEAYTKAIDAEIKALRKRREEFDKGIEKQKEKLEERLKKFKDYIDAQKESLKIEKETQDYLNEIEDKNDEIINIDNELLALQFDNSEEANAKRLELAAERAEKTEELEETQADRVYDLQVQALDNLLKKFEDNINKQIELLEKKQEAFDEGIEKQIEALETQKEMFLEAIEMQLKAIEEQKKALQDMAETMKSVGGGITGAIGEMTKGMTGFNGEIARAILYMTNLLALGDPGITIKSGVPHVNKGDTAGGFSGSPIHTGGLVESHHDGNFAGNLRSNEVFAKLLKGEYVSTENQMDNFMRKTLPKIMAYPSTNSANQKNGDIVFSMPITVQGNLDKSVLPDIEKVVDKAIDKINKTMLSRGYLRSANQTVS